jgi:hypothetical protein
MFLESVQAQTARGCPISDHRNPELDDSQSPNHNTDPPTCNAAVFKSSYNNGATHGQYKEFDVNKFPNKPRCTTFHRAKGSEWKVVLHNASHEGPPHPDKTGPALLSKQPRSALWLEPQSIVSVSVVAAQWQARAVLPKTSVSALSAELLG